MNGPTHGWSLPADEPALNTIHCDLAVSDFLNNGCCLLPRALPSDLIDDLCFQMDELAKSDLQGILKSDQYTIGIRNLLQLYPSIIELVRIPVVHRFIQPLYPNGVGAVRALLFDKPPEKSWTLPWHRDRTVAISPKLVDDDLPMGLRNRTIKAGIPHALAPDQLLSQMITLRFSLDPMTPENGPLYFLLGSHATINSVVGASYSSTDDDLGQVSARAICMLQCQAGDLFAMSPLLAHSSSLSRPQTKLRRRVVHIELAPADTQIPWYEFISI